MAEQSGARAVAVEAEPRVPVKLVDCDVHVGPQSANDILQHLPEPHRRRAVEAGRLGKGAAYYPPGGAFNRADGVSPRGLPEGSDPDYLAQQLLEESGVDFAILVPNSVGFRADEADEAALASAQNRWLVERWLTEFNAAGRYFGSILVSPRDADLAVREIELWANHPHVSQILVYPAASPAFGHPSYWPIYEAAEHYGLPIATHVRERTSIQRLTPVGFASYYIDQRVTQWITGAAHLADLVLEGVFARFPRLRFVMVELGYLWAASLMWRMDHSWREFREELPALERLPSEYVRENVRFTSQPFEAGPGHESSQKHFRRMLEAIDARRTLLFSTDYPHWDGDYVPETVLKRLSPEIRDAVAFENALALYGLPQTRADR